MFLQTDFLSAVLAALISHCTGSLARGLAGSLALAAAALSGSLFEISLVDSNDMLHWKNLR